MPLDAIITDINQAKSEKVPEKIADNEWGTRD
jgi:hypothetical protein